MKKTYNTILRSIFVVMMLLSWSVAFAQTVITGKVKDTKGQPVIGAVVMLNGKATVGTSTDLDGNYSLKIPSEIKKPALKASCIGYTEKITDVAGRTVVNFVLAEDNQELDEVIVVGYGSMRRGDLTGSVSSVKIDEVQAARSTSLDQLIRGRVPGVQIVSQGGSPDAGVSMRIRGLSSFNGSSEPLYVVDGIMINASQGGETTLSVSADNVGSDEQTNGLLGLNPQDIASIEILKDASATAIYGALGANGVVLITTKTPANERPTVNFSGGVDVSGILRRMDVLDFDEYSDYLFDMYKLNVGDASTYLAKMYEDVASRTGLKVFPIDWQDYCLHAAFSQRYYLSVQGRPETLDYSFSLGYKDRGGIYGKTGVKQYTIRLNLEKTLKKNLKFGTKTNFAYIKSEMTQGTGGSTLDQYSSAILSMLSSVPYTSDELDDTDDDDNDSVKAYPDKWNNPLHFFNQRDEYRITPNLFVKYTFLPWLTFSSTIGGDYRNIERQKFKSVFLNSRPEGTSGASVTAEYFNWNWDNLLLFNKSIKDHLISGTVGVSAQQALSTSQSVEAWQIKEYKAGIAALNGTTNARFGYGESQSQTLSYFARGMYNYKNRYLLTATFRADGSSKFQGANKWAYFPSFAAAWRINEEQWFNVPQVSQAKIRLGWGRVGNQSIGNYLTMFNYNAVSHPSHDAGNESMVTIGSAPGNIANPDLKWETTEQTNLGVELGFFNGRLAIVADAYNKTTYDLLQNKTIPVSNGIGSIMVNMGNIRNRGLELSVDAVPVKKGGFEWSAYGNISFNRNKIISMSETAEVKDIWVSETECKPVTFFLGEPIGGSNFTVYPANIFMTDYPMGLFYGFKVKGIVGVGETGTPVTDGGAVREQGALDYFDLNGNGYIDDDDRTVIGNPNPDFTFGFGTSFIYKNLSFVMDFNGSYGNEICNINSARGTATGSSARNVYHDAYYKAWTPDNTDTVYPAIGSITSDDYKKISSLYIEDASYLRLANISLSYTFARGKDKTLRNITLSASVDNVYLWTRYNGWDPDVNSYGTNVYKMSCDSGSYPSCRTASFDVKFTF